MCNAFGLIIGQCTARLANTLQTRKDWKTIEAKEDPIKLLSAIKEITQNFQDSKHPIATVHKQITFFFSDQARWKGRIACSCKKGSNQCAQDMSEQRSSKMALCDVPRFMLVLKLVCACPLSMHCCYHKVMLSWHFVFREAHAMETKKRRMRKLRNSTFTNLILTASALDVCHSFGILLKALFRSR